MQEEIQRLNKAILEIEMKETLDDADYSLIKEYEREIEELEKQV